MSSRICTRCAWRAWWSRRIALSSRICTRCAWRDLMNGWLNSSLVFVSVSFIIGFSWLIGGIGSGFIIIFSFINESLNPVITTLFGNDLLLSLFIILYSTSYAIVSLSNWLKFKIYVFWFRNFSVFFYIVYCNIAW